MHHHELKICWFSDRYAVSEDGKIWLVKGRLREKKTRFNKKRNHHYVRFMLGGKRRVYTVAVVVAGTWIRPPRENEYVRHIDGDFANCRASNLEWVRMASKITQREFLHVWNSSRSVSDAARTLGISENCAMKMAVKFRKSGAFVKDRRRKHATK